jgi:hypothetical protein
VALAIGNDDLELSNPQWLGRVATAMLVLGAGARGVVLRRDRISRLAMISEDAWLSVYEEGQIIGYVCAGYLAMCAPD